MPLRFHLRENRAQLLIVTLLGVATALTLTTIGLLFYKGRFFVEDELKLRLRSVAAASALGFDGTVVDKIRTPEDMKRPEFATLVRKLQLVMLNTPGVSSAYIMRKTEDPGVLSFVVDATSLASKEELDVNDNGRVDPDEVAPLTGATYAVNQAPAMLEGFVRPATDPEITVDQWGTTISGYAPVARWDNGKTVAMLGIDMKAAEYAQVSHSIFSSLLFLLIIVGTTSIVGGVTLLFFERRVSMFEKIERERMGLLVLASHQLGEPLTIFKYSTETLADDIDSPQLRDTAKEHISVMQDGITRMANILAVLKQAAKLDERGVQYLPAWHYLHDLVTDIRDECASSFAHKNQTVSLRFSGDMHLWLDRKLIANVFIELLRNASNYSPVGGFIGVSCTRHGGTVRIEVSDRGCGIPARDLPRLFEKFVRGSNARKFRPNGNGLGLYIVKGIVDVAGGMVRIASREGEGTVVTVDLPVEPSRKERKAMEQDA